MIACALSASAADIRIATFNTELGRDGPGLLLRDIQRGDDPQILAVATVLDRTNPDIVALQGIDWDVDLRAPKAFNQQLREPYPHLFSRRPNRGIPSGADLDGSGTSAGPKDALGFGKFRGQSGMVVLSRYPIITSEIVDLSGLLWRDVPSADLPQNPDGTHFFTAEALKVLPVSTTGHWVVPVEIAPGRRLNLLIFHASPPVFDGPEQRNRLRNAEEIGLWGHLLAGRTDHPAPRGPVVVLGDFNLDPSDGDGQRHVIEDLLTSAHLIDPFPTSSGGRMAAQVQGGANRTHSGDPAADTADWRDDPGPGNLRVDYVLPSVDLSVREAGVFWPAPESDHDLAALVETASRHRLVWLDLDL